MQLWMSVHLSISFKSKDTQADYGSMQDLCKNSRLPANHQLEWDDAISRIRYSYLQTLLPLQKKFATLSGQFPESLDAYRAMDNSQDMQLRVAKFLQAADSVREVIRNDCGWTRKQVTCLTSAFEKDVSIDYYVIGSFYVFSWTELDWRLGFVLVAACRVSLEPRCRNSSKIVRYYGILGSVVLRVWL